MPAQTDVANPYLPWWEPALELRFFQQLLITTDPQ